jgi:hypothetical protein
MALTTSIYLTFVHATSNHFNLSNEYDGRLFDLETWSCEVQAYYPMISFDDYNILGRQCQLSMASRVLSYFLSLFSLSLGVGLVFDWQRVNVIMVEKKYRRDNLFV